MDGGLTIVTNGEIYKIQEENGSFLPENVKFSGKNFQTRFLWRARWEMRKELKARRSASNNAWRIVESEPVFNAFSTTR